MFCSASFKLSKFWSKTERIWHKPRRTLPLWLEKNKRLFIRLQNILLLWHCCCCIPGFRTSLMSYFSEWKYQHCPFAMWTTMLAASGFFEPGLFLYSFHDLGRGLGPVATQTVHTTHTLIYGWGSFTDLQFIHRPAREIRESVQSQWRHTVPDITTALWQPRYPTADFEVVTVAMATS